MSGARAPAPALEAGSPPARLLDLSRLVSRAGRGPFTGIDRVEFAYLRALLAAATPLWGLVRLPGGHALLDRGGLEAVFRRLSGAEPWGPPDLRARLALRRSPSRGRAEADIRRLARARAGAGGLAAMLARHLPPGSAWIATGHADLTAEVFAAIHALPGGRASVLLHDTIPLDHPALCRAGTPARFAAALDAVAAGADLLILSSKAARAAALPHLTRRGRVPPDVLAPLGLDLAAPDATGLPPALAAPERPIFLALGTIEPRKNPALLLELWEGFLAAPPPGGVPVLVLAGARGWETPAFFRRLEALSARSGGAVIEAGGLSDAAVAALMERATALLFPSLAEGFGLPPAEAAARGLPIVATALPAIREVLGDYPAVYAPSGDLYLWRNAILALAGQARPGGRPPRHPPRPGPRWEDHFAAVLART